MCMMVIGAALSIGMGVMQAAATQQAKQADYAAKSAAWTQNVLNAEAAARNEHRQILLHQMQEQDKSVQKDHLSYIEQAQKSATVENSAAGAGVSGISLGNLLDDITQKSQYNRTIVDRNLMFVVADTQANLKSTDDRLMGRINSVERPVEPANTFLLDAGAAVAKPISGLATSFM